jgi:hypothetical protein
MLKIDLLNKKIKTLRVGGIGVGILAFSLPETERDHESSSNGVLHRPAHSSITRKSNPFFFYTLFSFSLRFRTPYQPANPPIRARPGQSTDPPQDLRAGILARQRSTYNLQQTTKK